MAKSKAPRIPSQLDLLVEISDLLKARNVEPNMRQTNAIVQATTIIAESLAKADRQTVPGEGLDRWLESDSTGSSSLTMARCLHRPAGILVTPKFPPFAWSFPIDAADFGRCLGLLEADPRLRPHLQYMAAKGPEWDGYVRAWPELEALYREESPTGVAPRLYARMQEIQEVAALGRGKVVAGG